MSKFLKALEEASKKSTPTNLHRLVELAKAIVEADVNRYKWREGRPSTADTLLAAEIDLGNEDADADVVAATVITKMKDLEHWYFIRG